VNLLITGVTGLLGVNLAWEARQAGHQVWGLAGRRALPGAPFAVRTVDLTEPAALDAVWRWAQPEAIIHTAAMANVDACERDPERAHLVNAVVPARLARWAAREGIPLVHISTDAVFDGRRGDYTEDDPPHPLSVYARTKLAGEQAVLEAHPQAVVVRVNFFGWSLSGTRSLAEWFFNHLRFGHSVPGFTDVFFCPLLANHLARLLLDILARGLRGLYHATSPRCLSKYAFGVALAERFGYDPTRIRPASVTTAGLTAPRSRNLTLRSDKLARALGQPLPDWQAGLDEFHRQYTSGYTETIRGWLTSPLEDAHYDYCAL